MCIPRGRQTVRQGGEVRQEDPGRDDQWLASHSILPRCPHLLPTLPHRRCPWQAGAATRATFNQDPASRYMPHLSLLYSDIDQPER